MKRVKICLSMIVKNESKIIERMLNSLKPILDYVSIEDTGSTDNTVEIIEKWGVDNNIKTKISYYEFINFGVNRTHALEEARKSFADSDYFILSDADFIWEISDDFKKELLNAPIYYVKQYKNCGFEWGNIRLLSNKKEFKCYGVTHEFWDGKNPKENIRTGKLSSIKIKDLCDGGCREDKFIRDEKLLKKALCQEKESYDHQILYERYHFYLAETLKNLGKTHESIDYYQKRIDIGGYQKEEIYYCMFQIGKLFKDIYDKTKDQKDFDKAEEYYLKAADFDKRRVEPIYHLVKMYREYEKYEKGYEYAMKGKQYKYDSTIQLFVDKCYYDTLWFDWELSIICFYMTDKKKEGIEAALRAYNRRKELPKNIRNLLKSNMDFYN